MPSNLTRSTAAIGLWALAWLPTAQACAQKPKAFNRLDFSNRVLTDRDDLFPGQDTKAGTAAGDGLFKVLPRFILERHGDHRVSGYRMAIAHQKQYRFQFGRVTVPEVQVFRTKIAQLGDPILGFKEYETIDPTRPLTGTFSSFDINLPEKKAYTVEVEFDRVIRIPSRVNGQRAGLAILARSKVGQSITDPFTPTAVLRPSYQERHFRPGRDSYSGSYVQASDTIAMYGMLGQPSPRGELYLSLLFENPTLSLFSSAAGGDLSIQGETVMGAGAYATDIVSSSKPTMFGFFGMAEQYEVTGSQTPNSLIPLVVAKNASGPTTTQLFNQAFVRLDPVTARLGDLFPMGAWGYLEKYLGGGNAGFLLDKRGSWASTRYVLPPRAGVAGEFLWLQGVVVDPDGNFLETTNAVRITLN